MERVKYVPVFGEGNNDFANEINLYFHFLQREREAEDTTYVDGWGVQKDELENPVWWNGYNSNDMSGFWSFVNSSGKTSDLLGYLDFTDNDVYFRKKKISRSFVRLSFYDSNDPVKAKLLYYSTIFLDSTALFGKYIKLKKTYQSENIDNVPHVENNGALIASVERNFVFAKTNPRLDSQITITNEYDRMRSAEGFNLYLFKDDAPETGTPKTIYMKVEFNHAGNGQTIPMILWPKENGAYKNLTLKDTLKALYIPVTLKKAINNGMVCYQYYIESAINENKVINLVLFEPKITSQEDNAV
jgi:hypothetical protein